MAKGPSQAEIATKVLNDLDPQNIIFLKKDFWFWNGIGIWRRVEDIKIWGQIAERQKNANAKTIDAVLKFIKSLAYRDDHEWDVDTSAINCPNGEVTITKDFKVEFYPGHRRESYRTCQIAVKYDPTAKAPRFLQFLQEIFEGDDDKDGKIQVILEMIGYTLTASCQFEKFIICIGQGANGKSKLLNVVEALCGQKNVSSIELSKLTSPFQRGHLHTKLANIVTEIAEGGQIPSEVINKIVSGDLLNAEHKNRPPFDFRPYCTLWYATNHMPSTRDFSNALFRRSIVVPFNNEFKDKAADPDILQKLLAELPGILNLALDALCELKKRGRFIMTQSMNDSIMDWKEQSDQVQQFVEDCCTINTEDETHWTESKVVYEAYQKWAKEQGIGYVIPQIHLTRRLKKFGVTLARTKSFRKLKYIMLNSVEGDI